MLFDSTSSSFCLSNARSLLTYIIFSPQITYPNMRSEQNQACSCLMPRIPRLLRYFLPQRLVSSHCELCAYPRQFYTILPLTSNLLLSLLPLNIALPTISPMPCDRCPESDCHPGKFDDCASHYISVWRPPAWWTVDDKSKDPSNGQKIKDAYAKARRCDICMNMKWPPDGLPTEYCALLTTAKRGCAGCMVICSVLASCVSSSDKRSFDSSTWIDIRMEESRLVVEIGCESSYYHEVYTSRSMSTRVAG